MSAIEREWPVERIPTKVPCDFEDADRPAKQGVGILIVSPDHPGQILMIQEKRDEDEIGTKRGAWTFPAGKLNDGEEHSKAAIREVKEEVGREIQSLNYIGPL